MNYSDPFRSFKVNIFVFLKLCFDSFLYGCFFCCCRFLNKLLSNSDKIECFIAIGNVINLLFKCSKFNCKWAKRYRRWKRRTDPSSASIFWWIINQGRIFWAPRESMKLLSPICPIPPKLFVSQWRLSFKLRIPLLLELIFVLIELGCVILQLAKHKELW